MDQNKLKLEVDKYNKIAEQLQTAQQQVTTFEQERLIQLGRVRFIQENMPVSEVAPQSPAEQE
jgi:hypothetical protein